MGVTGQKEEKKEKEKEEKKEEKKLLHTGRHTDQLKVVKKGRGVQKLQVPLMSSSPKICQWIFFQIPVGAL